MSRAGQLKDFVIGHEPVNYIGYYEHSPNVQRYALIKYTAPWPQPSGSAGSASSAFSYGRRDDAPLYRCPNQTPEKVG